MTQDDLVEWLEEQGCRNFGMHPNGTVIMEFQVYVIVVPKPVNGKKYDAEELEHIRSVWFEETVGDLVFTFNNGDS